MRRGRPPTTSQPAGQPGKPSRSPVKVLNGDPFAALDSKTSASGPGDELSSRFPTLDQFSILLESRTKFDFDDPASPPAAQQPKDLSQRVTERLADDAFAPTQPKPTPTPASQRQSSETSRPKMHPSIPPEVPLMGPTKSASAPPKPVELSRASAIISNSPELQAISSQTSQPLKVAYQPAPSRPVMVSTGTMTSEPGPERPTTTAPYQVYRFPQADEQRSSSLPRRQDPTSSDLLRADTPKASLSGAMPRVPPFQPQSGHARHPSSSRPSLEGGRPNMDQIEPMIKSKSTTSARPRPASTHLESNIDYLREREALPKPLGSLAHPSPKYAEKHLPPPPEPDDETNISSNVEFLRSMEDSDPKKKDKGYHKHGKRSSLTSLGAGTKNKLAGKFGDAFKRFEGSGPPPPRTPSPLKDLERRDLTPIAGSEATDGRSDDGHVLEETDDMTPEMRRELERRRLSQEEARVAAAGAEYRQRVQGGSTGPTPLPKSIGGVSRAVSIQNKVQSLLDESSRSTVSVTRTAQGYGHYIDSSPVANRPSTSDSRPAIPRKPLGAGQRPDSGDAGARRGPPIGGGGSAEPTGLARPIPAGGAPKPMAPPKPTHLNKNPAPISNLPAGGRSGSPPKPMMPPSGGGGGINAPRVRGAGPPREHLVAVDLPGQPTIEMSPAERDDYIRDFQKRFPSLTSIEMVERDLGAEAEAKIGR